LTLPNGCALILSTLLVAQMGFPSFGEAFDPETADECTQSKLNDIRHA
jgi:hypothetical protein